MNAPNDNDDPDKVVRFPGRVHTPVRDALPDGLERQTVVREGALPENLPVHSTPVNPNEIDGPHIAGDAECLACHYRWVAVAPVGTSELQCPRCGLHRGVGAEHLLRANDDVWKCPCGCWAMAVYRSGEIGCLSCGRTQNWDHIK